MASLSPGEWAEFDQDAAETWATAVDLGELVLDKVGGDPSEAVVHLTNVYALMDMPHDEATAMLAVFVMRAALDRRLAADEAT